jgi:hypothetical protein
MIDDFLLVTTDLNQAEEFLQVMSTGEGQVSRTVRWLTDLQRFQASPITDVTSLQRSLLRASVPTHHRQTSARTAVRSALAS